MAIRIIVTVLFSGITQYHTVTDFMYKSIFFYHSIDLLKIEEYDPDTPSDPTNSIHFPASFRSPTPTVRQSQVSRESCSEILQ